MFVKQIIYFSPNRVEFVSRELGWIYGGSNLLEKWGELDLERVRLVLLVGNSRRELDILRELPNSSIWIYLYADEIYDPVLNFTLLRSGSVRGVIRAYPILEMELRKFVWNQTKILLRLFYENSLMQKKVLIGELPRGMMFTFRKLFVTFLQKKSKKISISLFPGYTNMFASAFCRKFGLHSEHSNASLVELQVFQIPNVKFKELVVGFQGQVGKSWRSYALEKAKLYFSITEAIIELRAGFGGTIGQNGASMQSATTYLELMLKSQFTLCPPGNYSYGSFRILEALLSDSVPLICPIYSWDFTFVPPWLRQVRTEGFENWEDCFKFARESDSKRCSEIVKSQLQLVRSYINSVNNGLV